MQFLSLGQECILISFLIGNEGGNILRCLLVEDFFVIERVADKDFAGDFIKTKAMKTFLSAKLLNLNIQQAHSYFREYSKG